jgi:hypothetical protein
MHGEPHPSALELDLVVASFLVDGGPDPADIFDDLYANTPAGDWETAPAILDGDPANLFHFFPPTSGAR